MTRVGLNGGTEANLWMIDHTLQAKTSDGIPARAAIEEAQRGGRTAIATWCWSDPAGWTGWYEEVEDDWEDECTIGIHEV